MQSAFGIDGIVLRDELLSAHSTETALISSSPYSLSVAGTTKPGTWIEALKERITLGYLVELGRKGGGLPSHGLTRVLQLHLVPSFLRHYAYINKQV